MQLIEGKFLLLFVQRGKFTGCGKGQFFLCNGLFYTFCQFFIVPIPLQICFRYAEIICHVSSKTAFCSGFFLFQEPCYLSDFILPYLGCLMPLGISADQGKQFVVIAVKFTHDIRDFLALDKALFIGFKRRLPSSMSGDKVKTAVFFHGFYRFFYAAGADYFRYEVSNIKMAVYLFIFRVHFELIRVDIVADEAQRLFDARS